MKSFGDAGSAHGRRRFPTPIEFNLVPSHHPVECNARDAELPRSEGPRPRRPHRRRPLSRRHRRPLRRPRPQPRRHSQYHPPRRLRRRQCQSRRLRQRRLLWPQPRRSQYEPSRANSPTGPAGSGSDDSRDDSGTSGTIAGYDTSGSRHVGGRPPADPDGAAAAGI
jgi:hypothetical protein